MVLTAERPRTRVSRTRAYTVDQVLNFSDDDRIWELVDGQLEEKHVANRAAMVAFEVAVRFRQYRETQGGVVIPPEGFVRLFGSPQQLKRPDTGFVCAGRLANDELGDGYLDLAPDVVVEVVSPRDIAEKVEIKVQAYLAAGVNVVWLFYPQAGVVHVRERGRSSVLSAGEGLSAEDIMPGFALDIAEVLGTAARS